MIQFPNVFDLANASEQKVLKLWQGLGYYSRARNLHFTAKYIANNFEGKFPETYDEIIKLKGVGKYTAAAISSFAFNEKQAVVDGNVYRLLSRYFGIKDPIDSGYGQKLFSELANKLLPVKNDSSYNQAIMEFGALQCKPKVPLCNSCPLNSKCFGFNKNQIDILPVKTKKIKIKNRSFNYLVITDGHSVCLEKRTSKDIWENMYQFPMIEKEHIKFKPSDYLLKNGVLLKKTTSKHLLTHQKISAVFWHFEVEKMPIDKAKKNVKLKSIKNYPVPKIVENYLKENLAIEV
jgi:A/G-specific adenine glycosylase